MYQLTILSTILLSVSAKVFNYKDNYDNGLAGDGNFDFDNHKRMATVNRRPLWILNLKDDWNSQQLRLGTEEENEEFNYYANPRIKNNKRMKKNDSDSLKQITQSPEEQSQERNENIILQNEILKTINKFALSTNVEPDAHLSETEDSETSLELHFKGDYTTLVVKCDNKLWRYFINPPSPFPGWFYTIHDTDAELIPVPDIVKNKFYKSLLRMLQLVFSYPL